MDDQTTRQGSTSQRDMTPYGQTSDNRQPPTGEDGRGTIDQAREIAGNAGAAAQDVARRMREQTGEYVDRSVGEYPVTAMLVAGAVGYGLAYLMHGDWRGWNWATAGTERRRRHDDRRHPEQHGHREHGHAERRG